MKNKNIYSDDRKYNVEIDDQGYRIYIEVLPWNWIRYGEDKVLSYGENVK